MLKFKSCLSIEKLFLSFLSKPESSLSFVVMFESSQISLDLCYACASSSSILSSLFLFLSLSLSLTLSVPFSFFLNSLTFSIDVTHTLSLFFILCCRQHFFLILDFILLSRVFFTFYLPISIFLSFSLILPLSYSRCFHFSLSHHQILSLRDFLSLSSFSFLYPVFAFSPLRGRLMVFLDVRSRTVTQLSNDSSTFVFTPFFASIQSFLVYIQFPFFLSLSPPFGSFRCWSTDEKTLLLRIID